MIQHELSKEAERLREENEVLRGQISELCKKLESVEHDHKHYYRRCDELWKDQLKSGTWLANALKNFGGLPSELIMEAHLGKVGSVVEGLLKEIKHSRETNTKLKRENRIVRAESTDDRKIATDSALKEIRDEATLQYGDDSDIISGLSKKLKVLRAELSEQRLISELRNKQLTALHIIWCTGGCHGGVGNEHEVTQELVDEAVRNVERLKAWWCNRRKK